MDLRVPRILSADRRATVGPSGEPRRCLGGRCARWPWPVGHRPQAPSGRQLVPALEPARLQDGPPGPGRHPVTETVPASPAAGVRLECAFHSSPPRSRRQRRARSGTAANGLRQADGLFARTLKPRPTSGRSPSAPRTTTPRAPPARRRPSQGPPPRRASTRGHARAPRAAVRITRDSSVLGHNVSFLPV
jgi:hypothetical protein